MPIKLSFGQLYLPQTSSFAKNLPRAVENFTNKESSPSDRYAKKLTFGNTSLLFLEAILRGCPLQEMADHLESSPWMQRWLGLSSIRASSLHRKLERLPTESLQELCHQAAKKLATMYCDASLQSLGRLAAVDSSMVTLGSKRAEWAYVSKDFHAIKLRLSLGLVNETTSYPLRTVLSTAVVSDNDDEVLAALVEPSDFTYVFDRGYVNYGRYIAWNENDIRFNNKFRTIRERKCSGEIKRDATVEVVDAKSGCKTHLRLVEYRFLGTRKKWHAIRVLTNRTDLTAKQIARIYAWRWKIEIFRTHSGLLKHDKSI